MADEPQSDRAASAGGRPRWLQLGWVQIAIVAALVLLAVVYARSPGEPTAGAGAPFAAGRAETPPPLVRVVRPQPSATVLRVRATGSVNVRNYVSLTPQVGGRVVSVAAGLRAGGAFAAGEELLVIERRDFQLAYEQAQADVATAAADLQLRQAESDAAIANYALLQPDAEVPPLAAKAPPLAAEAPPLAAKVPPLAAKVPPLVAKAPQIAQAKARLAAAEARASIAALELERTAFALPFAGRVQTSTAEVGQVLSRGQPFGQVFALDAVEVVVPMPPDDLARLAGAVGRSATVESGELELAARVARVSPVLDQRSRFATLYLTFDDAAEALSPGTFVDVAVDGPAVPDTFVLPAAAEQVGGAVWTVADGTLRRRQPTELARIDAGWLVAAFDAADGVVLGAVPGAREGLPVQLAATPQPNH